MRITLSGNDSANHKAIRSILSILLIAVILLLFLVAADGCQGTSNEEQPDIYFPVQQKPQQQFLLASLPGELIVDNGYLRIGEYLIIWPHGYTYKEEGNDILILDDNGQEVLKTGEQVTLGGGIISKSTAQSKIGEEIPHGTEGPYWEFSGSIGN